MLLADDLNQLLAVLPKFISEILQKHPRREQLIEIVLDIGRRPEARFANHTEYLSYRTIVWQDLDHILKRLGKFSGDNRAGIEKTLHRISSLRNRQGSVIGLTCRIGRAIFGTVSIIRDLLEQKKSILLLGRPGVGKTTAIREIARVLSDGMQKRVIIIDTSNEIAGDGDLPHPSIGKARRMQVSNHQNQHEVMIEAVENHMPEIIIIDEIGTELEAAAARTIAERGVQLVGTAHGNTLENLVKNPTITDLIGGVQYVTLGDEEAKRRGSSKSILERKAPPTFDAAIEIHDPNTWAIHDNIEQSVDFLLQGQNFPIQRRSLVTETGTETLVDCKIFYNQKESDTVYTSSLKPSGTEKKQKNNYLLNRISTEEKSKTKNLLKNNGDLKTNLEQEFTFLYVYGINNQDLKSLIKTLKLPIIITKEIQYADAILALANLIKNNRKLKQISHSKKITIHTIQSNSLLQIAKALRLLAKKNVSPSTTDKNFGNQITDIISREFLTPLEETRLAIEEIVIAKNVAIDLFPRPSSIRKQQHELIYHYHLNSITVGKEKNKRLRIFPANYNTPVSKT
jgi:stage III sporulation protein AA|tara:strand:+ start:1425 stop:3131 length:1707 start_codon:yes stop_codon:yes gene_type:complete